MAYTQSDSIKQIHGALASHHHRHMWIITGPAGCGKSTVAQYLANELSTPYIEGDDVRILSLFLFRLSTDERPLHSTILFRTNRKCQVVNH